MGVSVGFVWNERRERAAMLVALDELSNEQIAREVGISRHCLDKWKRRPEFQERVGERVAEARESIRTKGIADLYRRVDALDRRWHEMQRLMERRKLQYANVPGGDTGLLVRVGGQGSGARGRGDWRQMGLWDGERTEDCGLRTERDESEALGESANRLAVDDGLGEYQVDGVLLDALLKLERQAAQELGQWERTDRDEGPTVLIRNYVGFDVEKV